MPSLVPSYPKGSSKSSRKICWVIVTDRKTYSRFFVECFSLPFLCVFPPAIGGFLLIHLASRLCLHALTQSPPQARLLRVLTASHLVSCGLSFFTLACPPQRSD